MSPSRRPDDDTAPPDEPVVLPPDVTPVDPSASTENLRARSAVGVVWMALQIWTVRLMSAVSFIVVGRQLRPEAFGLVALAGGIIAVLSIISDSGLATYVMRQATLTDRIRNTAFWTSLGIAAVLTAALAASAAPLAAVFDEPGLTPVLWWLSASLLLTGANSLPNALMRRDMRFKALAARGTASTFVGAAVAITLALLGAGVWALVAQALSSALVNTVLLWVAVDWRPRFEFDRRHARTMLSFGSKLLGIDLLMQARDRGEEFVLAGVASTTTLGFWSVATRLIKLVQDTGSQVISSVATPAFAKLQDDLPRLFRAYETSMTATGTIIFPAMLFLAATSPDAVPLILGEQWVTTGSVAQISALSAAVAVFSYFDRTVFVAVDKLRPEMLLVLTIVATHLGVVLVAAPHGLVVLATALLARTVLTFPLRQVVLHRVVGVPYRCLLRPFRVFLAAAGMAALVLAATTLLTTDDRWIRMLVFAGVAAVTYPALLLLVARPVAREYAGEVRRLVQHRRGRQPAVADPAGERPAAARR